MLTEEGAVFKSLKIVEDNIFNEQGRKLCVINMCIFYELIILY